MQALGTKTRHDLALRRAVITVFALAGLAGCDGFDADLRDIGNGFDTSSAVQQVAGRPRPDARGVISYPTYQVAVAQRGDTIRTIATRLGLDPVVLADYNGIDPDVLLRRDEIVALPTRVDEATDATGAAQPLDVSTVATTALDRAATVASAATTPSAPAPPATPEPIRHQVQRGETVFSISRLYNVPVRSIAEWNGLDAAFTIREGQFLLLPQGGGTRVANTNVTAPGAGTVTPVPPSAATPLPDTTAPVAAAAPASPDLGAGTVAPASTGFLTPVQGPIIRAYAPGQNEGVDYGVPAGTEVKAVSSGTVAAVTTDTSGGAIVVIKHDDGLLTVYTQMENLTVSKDDSVTRGQVIGQVREGDPSFLHFEVRRGLQSLDPANYLP